MLKKNLKILSVISIMLLLLSSTCFAAVANKDVAMEVVENNVCTVKINEFTTFEKKMISYDLEKKEITMQLKVTNTAEPVFDKPTEIFLVIDNSLSMQDEVAEGVDRITTVTNSAKTFATTLLANENVKIGIVKFSTGDDEGTISDATLLTTPTSNKNTVLSAITSIAEGELGPRTNIDAGITVASQNFTETCDNKYIILLTDGVPNTTINGVTFTYSGEVAIQTKAKLQILASQGIKFYSMMTGVQNVEEPSTGITYQELAEEVFGTTELPTVGKFYYIPDSKIEKTICETILEDMTVGMDSTLTDLKIYDFFPQEIVDNFEFSYVTKPTKGTISEDIDLQNNMIVWSIDKLEPGESATVSYKLKLKANVSEEVLNKIVKTNTKVDITAEEIDPLTSDVAPKIRIVRDVSPTPIPQTGITPTIMVIGLVFIGASTLLGIRLYNINKK